jgi:hypothetical protein
MIKFFIKAFILFIMVSLLALSLTLVPIPEYTYNFAIIDKHRILADTKSPKIVLVGGSNLAFGIDSAAIRNGFDTPVVNMGINAGFGLGRMLVDISPFLQRGDILLVIPEYAHFTTLWNGNSDAYQLMFNFRQFRLLWPSYYSLPTGLSRYFSDQARRLQDIILLNKRKNSQEDLQPETYTRDGFNEYGDYIKHLELEDKEFDSFSEKHLFNKSYFKHFFKLVDNFTKRGITVVFSYQCLEEQSFLSSAALIRELDIFLRTKENLKVISTPESYCLPKDHFYDNYSHLNALGRTVRTEQLIRDLQESGLFAQEP